MNKLSPKAAEATRKEWRELGFFYTKDDHAKEWHLVGSKDALFRFSELLENYATNNRHSTISEHEHYGPHMYLEVMTWTEAGIDDHSIHGSLEDIHRLANIVRSSLSSVSSGQIIRIREQYTPAAEFSIILSVKSDSFDPASLDPQLAG